jgi:hypothetical protein
LQVEAGVILDGLEGLTTHIGRRATVKGAFSATDAGDGGWTMRQSLRLEPMTGVTRLAIGVPARAASDGLAKSR